MKKRTILTAALLAAVLLPGSAVAASRSAAHSHGWRHACQPPCKGYYSLYTYVAPCHGGLSGGGCGRGGYAWVCGGIFGW